MAKGNEIVLSADPRGVFLEGIVSGTPKPGTVMEVKNNTALVSGRATWQASTKAHATRQLVAVLLPDSLQGQLSTTAYVTATRCFLYCPAAGEDMNMLLQYEAGTGTSGEVQVGNPLEINNGGKLQTVQGTGYPAFTLMEHLGVAFTADKLVFCKFNGH